jgi:membrane protease subunit HflC
MRPLRTYLFWPVVACLALWAAWQSVVFVDETELVVVTNFGELVAVYDQTGQPAEGAEAAGAAQAGLFNDRGWHFKLPWQAVRRFDRRLRVFDPPAREMVTYSRPQDAVSEVGGNLTVSSYVCWRIPHTASAEDLSRASEGFDTRPVVRFLRTARTPEGAELRLDNLVRSRLGIEISKVQLSDLVNVAPQGEAARPSVIGEIGRRITAGLAGLEQEVGIRVVDVEIKRLNLPEGNRSAVYARQKSERQRIANKYRSEGKAEAVKIASQAARESETLLAESYAKAQATRGEGEAAATETYSAAYARDPELFQLLRALEAYETMLGNQTTLILSADSKIFKTLTEGTPAKPAVLPPRNGSGE